MLTMICQKLFNLKHIKLIKEDRGSYQTDRTNLHFSKNKVVLPPKLLDSDASIDLSI